MEWNLLWGSIFWSAARLRSKRDLWNRKLLPHFKTFFGNLFFMLWLVGPDFKSYFLSNFFISLSDFLFMQFFIGQIFCWSNFLFLRLLWYDFQVALTAVDVGYLVFYHPTFFTFLWKLHNIHMIVWKLRCILEFQKIANTVSEIIHPIVRHSPLSYVLYPEQILANFDSWNSLLLHPHPSLLDTWKFLLSLYILLISHGPPMN